METSSKGGLALAVVVLVVLLASLGFAEPTAAGLPPRPTPLPPAPEPLPGPAVAGASLELQVELGDWHEAWSSLWTMVQWQDAEGDWHDVEGWRGPLDELQEGLAVKMWWVAEADFGTGPFRWLIYDGEGGDVLAESDAFHLPNADLQEVTVEADLSS